MKQMFFVMKFFIQFIRLVSPLYHFGRPDLESAIASCIRSKFALLIGVKDNLHLDLEANLKEGPINNCNLVRDALLAADPSWNITTLLGDKATKDNIMAHVGGLVKQASKAPAKTGFQGERLPAVVMVYFAGHGRQSNGVPYLVPFLKVPGSPHEPVCFWTCLCTCSQVDISFFIVVF